MKHAGAIGLLTILCCALTGTLALANEQPAEPLRGLNDSGVQLNRTRQYLEWQRTQEKIAEGRRAAKVEQEERKEPTETGKTIQFVLKGVTTDTSIILQEEDINSVTKAYIGKEISLQDLYDMAASINKIYAEKGYATCRAYIGPQRITGGVVHISLIEGKTNDVIVQGNTSTRTGYILHRLPLTPGKISNINDLNESLLRFNATNDVQLRIAMKAGKKPETTDYVITAQEPQREAFGIFADNAGSTTSGLYREGMYWQERSLTGNRDSLMLSAVRSDGTKSASVSYTMPLNRNGTKLGFSHSSNSVHIVDGPMEPLNVRGHSYAWGLSLVQPLKTTETVKAEAGMELNYQNSKTDFSGIHWVDDTIQGVTLYADQIDYGKTTIFYQKHAYRFGVYEDIADTSRQFGKYSFNTLYQRSFAGGQMLSARLDGQLSSTPYLPSAEQFYIGGIYSVRGYTESLLGGDSGFMASLEYAVPITKSKQTSAYIFVDGGRVFGDSAYGDKNLVSTGFGIKTNIGDHMSANIGVGIPLIRTINDVEQSHGRVHFSFNGQF